MNYKLKVHGPFKICDESFDMLEDCPYSKNKGIYFWAVKMKSENYKITYIGETSASFYKRTKEHIIQTFGGNYQVYDTTAMRKGTHKVLWNGLWRKGTRDKLPEFIRNYQNIAPEIEKNLKAQVMFVIPLKTERRDRQRIEGAIAKHILNNEKASSIFPKDIRYFYRKENEDIIKVLIESAHKIEGLPKKLNA